MVAQIAEQITRLDQYRDMPAGLEERDALAYRIGYGKGCVAYTRKHGAPAAVHDDGPAPAAGTAARVMLGRQLAAEMRTFELQRHPSAHRAGMSALNKSRKTRGLDPVTDPVKPARKAPARKLSAVPDAPPVAEHGITAAEVAEVHVDGKRGRVERVTPVPDAAPARNTRKAARRALASAMRARGENPADLAAWTAAKLAAGVK